MLNLAIVSPSITNKFETFVQSHVIGIKAHSFLYYGDLVPRYIDGEGLFSMDNKHLSDIKSWLNVFKCVNPFLLYKSGLSLKEFLFVHSLKKHKIDVVLAEYGTTSAEIVNSCKYANIPLVAHFHGRDSSAYSIIKDYKKKYEDLFAYASAVVIVSKEMQIRLEQLGCPKDKMIYAPCVPDEKFAQLHALLDQPSFCFVGRFTDKKAPYAVVMAFKKVIKKIPYARLIMSGDGPLLNSTKNIVKILGIEDNVIFTGIITPEEYRTFLLHCRAYVQHSIIADDGDMEGTPVAIMEASAAGVSVISTIHAGIPDIIIDGETGLLNKELDVDGMAANMILLLEDKDLAVRLGNAGKQRMSEHFTKRWQMNILTKAVTDAALNKVNKI